MKTWKRLVSAMLVCCLVLGLTLTTTVLPASAARKALTDQDFLSVSGSKLVNHKGETVALRGVNLGGWLIQESWMCPVNGEDRAWANLDSIEALQSRGFTEAQIQELFDTYQNNWITEYDLDIIAETGVNVVRVPFWYRNFMTDANGTWITSNMDENPGFKRLDWVIAECKERGMYVILDMHGCPGGQSMDHCCGTLGKNELYTNTTYQQAMKDLWTEIAKRYKNEPAVAAYDVMNEPQNNSGYEGENSWDPWDPESWRRTNEIYAMMVPVIREQDPDHVITVEGIWRATNLPDPKDHGWTNMMYQVHLYDDDDAFQDNLDQLVEVCNRYGVAGYVGEFSNLNGIGMCEAAGVNWTTWTYKAGKQVGGWGWYVSDLPIADTTRDSFDTIKQKWGSALRTNSGNFSENEWVINTVRAVTYVDPDDELVESWTRYEAEQAQRSEGSKLNQNNANFSGRQFIGELNTVTEISNVSEIAGDWSNIPYVKYTVTTEKAGTYRMRIGYATSTANVVAYVRVGDQAASEWQRISLPSSGGWQTVQTRAFDVRLPAGMSEFWLSGSTQGDRDDNWINYDYIELGLMEEDVTPPDEGGDVTPPDEGDDDKPVGPQTRYEAEQAEKISDTAVLNRDNDNFSGGSFIGGLNTVTEIGNVSEIADDWSNIPYIRCTVTVEKAGTYRLNIGYATSTEQAVAYIRVGDQAASDWRRIVLSSTGSWETVGTQAFEIRLAAGTNELWMSGSTQGKASDNWINYDYIELELLEAEDRILPGDVNGDGSVNSSDARLILQHAVGAVMLEDWQLQVAELNQDGSVNSTDARLVLQAAVN